MTCLPLRLLVPNLSKKPSEEKTSLGSEATSFVVVVGSVVVVDAVVVAAAVSVSVVAFDISTFEVSPCCSNAWARAVNGDATGG